MWWGSSVTTALSPGVMHSWLTLLCVLLLPPPGFVIMDSGKEEEEADFVVSHSRMRIKPKCKRWSLRLVYAPADMKGNIFAPFEVSRRMSQDPTQSPTLWWEQRAETRNPGAHFWNCLCPTCGPMPLPTAAPRSPVLGPMAAQASCLQTARGQSPAGQPAPAAMAGLPCCGEAPWGWGAAALRATSMAWVTQ